MSSIPVPNPAEAARLRRMYDGNPVIERAAVALTAFRDDLAADQAAQLLPLWKYAGELSDRERQAVIAFFVPPAPAFPWLPECDAVLAAAAELDPADDSVEARQLRETAASVRDHREYQQRAGLAPGGAR